MTRVVAIAQARTTSTRLPRKVLKTIAGRTLLEIHLERLRRCAAISEVVLATTTNSTDDELAAFAKKLDVRCFRGSEDDVLSRYHGAARDARAEAVVRVTSDCPLWDPIEGAKVVTALFANRDADLVNNVEPRTYPRGLDTEAFWIDVLDRMQRMAPATASPAREHVTAMAYGPAQNLFIRKSVHAAEDHSRFRWCVDTPDDLAAVEALIQHAGDPFAAYPQLLACALAHPEIALLNAHVEQKKT